MIRTETLPNGLRIVTDAMPGLASATLGLWVTAGARHERQDETGIAHFLEHMAFKGTATRSARQIAEAIEDRGGYLNAWTSRETTAYYARVLADDVALALEVLADIVLNPAFDAAEIATERHVILQEIGQALDTPDDIIFDWLQEAAYPGQPMGQSILGPAAHVERFTAPDFCRFTAAHYGADRLILAAAGAVDHDALVAQARALFGGLAAAPACLPAPARFAPGERREVRPLEQVHLALAFEAPAWRDAAAPVAQVWATAMGGGMSSRLFQRLREERGLCYSVFAQAAAHEDTGNITLYAGTAEEDAAELLALAADELRRAACDLTEAETARARAQLRASLLMGQESPSQRAERAARQLAIWGRVPDIAETVARIDDVTAAAARDFGGALAAEGRVAMAVLGPGVRAPTLDAFRARLAA